MGQLVQSGDGSVIFQNADGGIDMQIGGPAAATVAGPRFYAPRVMKIPLAGLDAAAACFSWANPYAFAILVTRVIVDVTVKSTAAGTLSIGQAATSVLSANLVDTLDVGTAIGTFDNITEKGTLGKSRVKVAPAAFITGSRQSGALAGLVGFAYIEFTPL